MTKHKRNAKEKLQKFADRAPFPPSHPHKHHQFQNQTAAGIFAVLLMVQGVCCIFLTEWVYRIFPFLVGCFMTSAGLFEVSVSIHTKEYRKNDTKLISQGIINLVLGGVILYHHREADSLIGSIWGVIGLIKGSESLNLSIYHMAAKEHFLRELIHGVIELLLAILLLLDPLTAVAHHLVILGLEFLTIGIQTAADAISASKNEEGV